MSYVGWLAALTTLALAIVALALELASSRRRTTELQGRLNLLEKTLKSHATALQSKHPVAVAKQRQLELPTSTELAEQPKRHTHAASSLLATDSSLRNHTRSAHTHQRANDGTSRVKPRILPPPPSPSRVKPKFLPPPPSPPQSPLMPPELLLPVSTKGPITQALLPQALSSGPESGFCNQIFALVGWSCIARFRKVALILPNWTSHDHGGYHIPHEKLFQYEPIARRLMECCNITVYRSPEHIPPTMKIWRPSAHEGGALAGWRKYKTLGHAGFTELVEVHERAVFQGLVPVASLREKVDQTKRLLLGGGGDGGAPSYGCLHARIETDMIASWRVNLAGPPPSLNDYLQTMSKMDAITRLKYVFVAVGLAITDKDKHELTKRTPWGAQLVQTTTGKSWHRNIHHEKHNTTQPSYIEASIVDFYTCREASWLVGWPGTTFGRTLAGLQIFDHQDGGWYRVCPPGGATPKELGPTIKWVSWYNNHQACMNKSQTYKKLGG